MIIQTSDPKVLWFLFFLIIFKKHSLQLIHTDNQEDFDLDDLETVKSEFTIDNRTDSSYFKRYSIYL